MVAISASVHPASASLVTAVPLRSWNVTPKTPAFARPFSQLERIDIFDVEANHLRKFNVVQHLEEIFPNRDPDLEIAHRPRKMLGEIRDDVRISGFVADIAVYEGPHVFWKALVKHRGAVVAVRNPIWNGREACAIFAHDLGKKSLIDAEHRSLFGPDTLKAGCPLEFKPKRPEQQQQ